MRPTGWQARLAHGVTALAAAPLRPRYGGPLPPGRVSVPEERRVPIPAGALTTLLHGDDALAPPAVLLHGLNANARYWTGVASVLRGPRRVLAPDLRGHGGTGPLPGGYGIEAFRVDLLAWLDQLGLSRVDLIGHSMGGKIAADLAAAAPGRVRRLILVDPVPPEGIHGLLDRLSPLRRAIFAPERGPFASAGELAGAHRTISWLRHAEPWMHAAFDANFVAAPDGTIRPVCDEAIFDELYRRVLTAPSPLPLERIAMPTLLVRATFSVMPFSGQVRRLAHRVPRLRSERLSGEHSLHATNPVGLARLVESFLAEREP